MPHSTTRLTLPTLGEGSDFGSTPCQVMGILNITPDSFSDGGRWNTLDTALAHAREMVAQGAHIIDIGGESPRPGATRVTAEEEAARVVPVVTALHAEGVTVSVDTMRASVAAAAVDAGADLINDVSGGEADPDMRRVMADAHLPYCVMHWQTDTFGDAAGASYSDSDIIGKVVGDLQVLVERALAVGVEERNIVLDPGLGFAKTRNQDWELLRGLPYFVNSGFPVLVGASRKRFLGELLAHADPRYTPATPPEPVERDLATAVVSAICGYNGVWCVRVHDVPSTVQALVVQRAWQLGHNPFGREQ